MDNNGDQQRIQQQYDDSKMNSTYQAPEATVVQPQLSNVVQHQQYPANAIPQNPNVAQANVPQVPFNSNFPQQQMAYNNQEYMQARQMRLQQQKEYYLSAEFRAEKYPSLPAMWGVLVLILNMSFPGLGSIICGAVHENHPWTIKFGVIILIVYFIMLIVGIFLSMFTFGLGVIVILIPWGMGLYHGIKLLTVAEKGQVN